MERSIGPNAVLCFAVIRSFVNYKGTNFTTGLYCHSFESHDMTSLVT